MKVIGPSGDFCVGALSRWALQSGKIIIPTFRRNLESGLGQYPCEQPHIYEKESESEIWHFQPTGPDRVLPMRDRDPIGSREFFAGSTKSPRPNDLRRQDLCYYNGTEDRRHRNRRLFVTGGDLFLHSPRYFGW